MALRMKRWLEEEHAKIRPILDMVDNLADQPIMTMIQRDQLRQIAAHIEHLVEECRRLTKEPN